jgi:hypothetical protein
MLKKRLQAAAGTRLLAHSYVDRIKVNPYKYTGVMYIPADAGVFLSAEHIRRVNVGWGGLTSHVRGGAGQDGRPYRRGR